MLLVPLPSEAAGLNGSCLRGAGAVCWLCMPPLLLLGTGLTGTPDLTLSVPRVSEASSDAGFCLRLRGATLCPCTASRAAGTFDAGGAAAFEVVAGSKASRRAAVGLLLPGRDAVAGGALLGCCCCRTGPRTAVRGSTLRAPASTLPCSGVLARRCSHAAGVWPCWEEAGLLAMLLLLSSHDCQAGGGPGALCSTETRRWNR